MVMDPRVLKLVEAWRVPGGYVSFSLPPRGNCTKIFPDKAGVVKGLSMYENLINPSSNGSTYDILGREYTPQNFQEYLVDHCGVKSENAKIALDLIKNEART